MHLKSTIVIHNNVYLAYKILCDFNRNFEKLLKFRNSIEIKKSISIEHKICNFPQNVGELRQQHPLARCARKKLYHLAK